MKPYYSLRLPNECPFLTRERVVSIHRMLWLFSSVFSFSYLRQWDTLQDVYTKQIFQCLRNVHRRSGESGFQTITTRVTQGIP